MNLNDLDLGEFMQDVGRSGVTMMIKIDHERMRQGGKPWTVLLRPETRRFDRCPVGSPDA